MCYEAAAMDLVCCLKHAVSKHVRSHLSLLTEAHLASFLPAFNKLISSVACQPGWHSQLTPPSSQARTHRAARAGQHKPLNPQTSISISRSRRLPLISRPCTYHSPTRQSAAPTEVSDSSMPPTFHLYSSRLHSRIQPTRNTG